MLREIHWKKEHVDLEWQSMEEHSQCTTTRHIFWIETFCLFIVTICVIHSCGRKDIKVLFAPTNTMFLFKLLFAPTNTMFLFKLLFAPTNTMFLFLVKFPLFSQIGKFSLMSNTEVLPYLLIIISSSHWKLPSLVRREWSYNTTVSI